MLNRSGFNQVRMSFFTVVFVAVDNYSVDHWTLSVEHNSFICQFHARLASVIILSITNPCNFHKLVKENKVALVNSIVFLSILISSTEIQVVAFICHNDWLVCGVLMPLLFLLLLLPVLLSVCCLSPNTINPNRNHKWVFIFSSLSLCSLSLSPSFVCL